jgi:hypothetical protein
MVMPINSRRRVDGPENSEDADRRQIERDRAADVAFVRAGFALLDNAARTRAQSVRLKAGDLVTMLLDQRA